MIIYYIKNYISHTLYNKFYIIDTIQQILYNMAIPSIYPLENVDITIRHRHF